MVEPAGRIKSAELDIEVVASPSISAVSFVVAHLM
jgi:hypothetical protein